MLTFISIVLVITTAILVAYLTRKNATVEKQTQQYGGSVKVSQELNPVWLVKPILTLIVGIFIIIVNPYNVERVDAGCIGVKVNLTGDKRGVSDYTYKTGWVVYNSWTETLHEFPTYQQHIEYGEQQIITLGGFPTNVNPTFNYTLKPDKIGNMFQSLRVGIKDVEQGWLKNAIIGSVNDVSNRWTIDNIFNKREQYEAEIKAECNKRVSQWFTVSQLRTNIDPPQALKEAIIAKTKAIQDAQAESQKALVAKAEAEKKIAIARGDSAESVIKASGNAQADIIEARGVATAMKLKKSELTPMIIQQEWIKKWDGALPTTTTNGNLMIGLPNGK